MTLVYKSFYKIGNEEHLIRWWHKLYIWILRTRTDVVGIRYKEGFGRIWILKNNSS